MACRRIQRRQVAVTGQGQVDVHAQRHEQRADLAAAAGRGQGQQRFAVFHVVAAQGQQQRRGLEQAAHLFHLILADGVTEAKKRLAVLVKECLVDHACSLLVVAAPSSSGE